MHLQMFSCFSKEVSSSKGEETLNEELVVALIDYILQIYQLQCWMIYLC